MLKKIKLFKLASKIFKVDNNEIIKINNSKVDKLAKNLSKFKIFKNIKFKILICIYSKIIKKLTFLISNIRKAFKGVNQVFIKVLNF